MLLLTSYERMRRYLTEGDTLISDSLTLKRDLVNWIMSVSSMIQNFLGYEIDIKSRTEYFDVKYSQLEYWLGARPLITLTSVYEDSSGEWTGGESEVTDCFKGQLSASVCLPQDLGYVARNALRIIYTGGMAYDGAKSVFAITGLSNSFSIGNYIKGTTSEAVGIVRAASSNSLTVENLYGLFASGEVLTAYSTEECTTQPASPGSATLSSITQQSLAEAYPAITRACEMQIRYMWKHKNSFEITSDNKDGSDYRRGDVDAPILQPEVMNMLQSYRSAVL